MDHPNIGVSSFQRVKGQCVLASEGPMDIPIKGFPVFKGLKSNVFLAIWAIWTSPL